MNKAQFIHTHPIPRKKKNSASQILTKIMNVFVIYSETGSLKSLHCTLSLTTDSYVYSDFPANGGESVIWCGLRVVVDLRACVVRHTQVVMIQFRRRTDRELLWRSGGVIGKLRCHDCLRAALITSNRVLEPIMASCLQRLSFYLSRKGIRLVI